MDSQTEEKFHSGQVSDLPLTEPVPLPELGGDKDPNRLWIGNLDPLLSEFSLLKILQTCGTLAKYDYLYHKTGPEKGQPRGYCFATYGNREEAVKAKKTLSGRKIMSKRIFVKWAHEEKLFPERKTVSIVGTGTELATSSKADIKDPQSAIRAIEAKLDSMQRNQDVKLPQPLLTLGPLPKTKDTKNAQKPYHRKEKR